MEDATDDAKTSQFAAITGAPAETAAFYLESCGGNVQAAIDAYLTNAEGAPSANFAADAPGQEDEKEKEKEVSGGGSAPPGQQGAGSNQSRGKAKRGGNIRGFSDLGGSGDEEEGEDNEDNEYYAGGEKSGVAVKGGGKKEKVDGLFDSARKHGAVEGTEQDLQPNNDGTRAFTGTARTLSGGETVNKQEDATEQSHTITFYENGIFVVNDGEPREISDPANASFINAITKGECPRELVPEDGGPVNVSLVKKDTKYVPPEKPKYVAFAGQGQSLAEGSGPSGSTSASAGAGVVAGGEWDGPCESEPTTSIQIRMYDGSRTVARFNHRHTVLDIRRFIAAVRPDMPLSYGLMTSFPSANLTDDSATIEGAGLLNAVIIQKL